MPAFALAIFDFDGTLADSFPWFCSILDRVADEFGLKRVDPGQIPTLRDLSSREALARLGVPLMKLPAISIFMRRIALESAAGIPMFAGAARMLASLHAANVRLALVSSNAEDAVRAVLGPSAGFIDHYACGSSLWGKAAKFRTVLKTARIDPQAGIAIGDEIRDIDSAREAGLSAGAVTFGFNTRKALEGHRPDYLFDSYDDLERAVIGGGVPQ
jgi:phosphoglycolate phosphatase